MIMKIKLPTEHLSCVDLYTRPRYRILRIAVIKRIPYKLFDKLSSLGDFLGYSKTPPIMCRRQEQEQFAGSLGIGQGRVVVAEWARRAELSGSTP